MLFGFMAEQLELTTSFTNILPQNEPMVDEFNMIIEEYDGASSMLIVAEGHPDSLVAFAESVVPRIEVYDQWVGRVDYKLPRDFMADHSLMLMKSSDLDSNKDLFLSPNLDDFMENLNNSLEKEYITSEEKITGREQEQSAVRFLDGIQSWIESFDGSLEGSLEKAGEMGAEAILFGDQYYRSWDRRMIILQILPSFTMFDVEKSVESTNEIEALVHSLANRFNIQAGLTGTIPLARDEMVAIQNDSMTITILALVGILTLFVVAFRMLVSPLLAIITLIIGVVWAMGLAWPMVGQLNLMTSMTAVILVGLGIDFSIHIISTYTEMRHRGESVADSMKFTLRKSGPGIITGGLTTASAFLTMLVSKTDGMREFGLVLGVGILMTMLAALLVLPTLLVIRERIRSRFFKKHAKIKARDIRYRQLGQVADGLAKRWKLGMILVLIVLVFFGIRGSRITMDYNYLNMEPKGLESIALQDRLIEVFDISSDYALITADNLTDARDITEQAKDLQSAGMVQSIVDFLPPREEQASRSRVIQSINNAMNSSTIKTETALDIEKILEEAFRLEANVMEIQDMAYLGGQDKVYLKSALLVGILPDEDDPSLTELNQNLAEVMDDVNGGFLTRFVRRLENDLAALRVPISAYHNDFSRRYRSGVLKMANPQEILIDDLPDGLRSQYVAKSGTNFLIAVYPKQNVWEIDYLKRFSNDLADIDPRATGLPPVFNKLMDAIGADGGLATRLAIIVIFLILLADLRNVRKALMAMIPLVVGAVWMVGIMEISGLQLTLLNIMAIPMIIGIGIDDGVHIVHRYQIEGQKEHGPVFSSTGRAIFLTSVTTMVGFGSLWFASYRGLGSMGIALFIGVGACFLATVFVIPSIIGMFSRQSRRT
jgi:predicted RND superfamily exporter protein